MYSLANDSLAVSILDPVVDRDRFGTRYCTGGYIFQIDDYARGPLLSGPSYPRWSSAFNGQGIPDAFNVSPLSEPGSGPTALIPGIGLCDLVKDQVVDFCQWQVAQPAGAITMRTEQSYQGFALELERTVRLAGRTLRSWTRLRNTGRPFLPLRWFPHPFFPVTATDELCRFSFPVGLPENPGFALAENGYVVRKGWPWQDGYFQAVDLLAPGTLVVLQKHPVLGLVSGTTSYVPSFMPIWGNRFTFSWEPFLERTLAPGQAAEWWIDYDF